MLLTITSLIAVAVAGIDLVWQRFDHARRLRMSFQDLREETKQSEGDPYVKAQRRSRGEAIATNRMLLDVPKADVVIVNPTHYAVALKWSRARGSAPACVAKGEGEVALRIREVAETAGVAVHSDPPTARALHATVEIGREITPEHYRAVAAAIRFADRIRRAARERGGRDPGDAPPPRRPGRGPQGPRPRPARGARSPRTAGSRRSWRHHGRHPRPRAGRQRRLAFRPQGAALHMGRPAHPLRPPPPHRAGYGNSRGARGGGAKPRQATRARKPGRPGAGHREPGARGTRRARGAASRRPRGRPASTCPIEPQVLHKKHLSSLFFETASH